jgi:hypothetical protein
MDRWRKPAAIDGIQPLSTPLSSRGVVPPNGLPSWQHRYFAKVRREFQLLPGFDLQTQGARGLHIQAGAVR